MTRKEALEYINNMWMSGETHDALEALIPEFGESEDERIRKTLIEFLTDIKRISESGRTVWAVRKEDAEMCKSSIAYLEKQKEQEQPEVDLEKEIDACWQNWISPSNQSSVEGVLPKSEFSMYARHFYELGLNARKEESK